MAHSAELATLSALARTLADAVSSLSTLAHAPAGTVPSSFEPAATSLALARTVAGGLKDFEACGGLFTTVHKRMPGTYHVPPRTDLAFLSRGGVCA